MNFITKITTQGQVTIPISVRKELGLSTSDKVLFVKENNRIYIKPAKNFLDLKGSIKSKKVFSDEKADKEILKSFEKDE